jgi:hypothetical protein
MDANLVLWNELEGRGISSLDQLKESEVVELAMRYAVWIPTQTFEKTPWLAPYALRKGRIRIDARAPGGKRDLWGFPDENGYFTDDNSLIKSVFQRRSVRPSGSAYGIGRFKRGLVCCHVWSGTTNNPLLFSFIPNLVWLPSSLAPFSDGHLAGEPHPVHKTLKQVSFARYFQHKTEVAQARVAEAWKSLQVGELQTIRYEQYEFEIDSQLIDLVNSRLTRITNFLTAVLEKEEKPQRFSKRFHAGVGKGIDPTTPAIDKVVHAEKLEILLAELKRCQSK